MNKEYLRVMVHVQGTSAKELVYLNAAHIVKITPNNGDFSKGAVISISHGNRVEQCFVDPGESAQAIKEWLEVGR